MSAWVYYDGSFIPSGVTHIMGTDLAGGASASVADYATQGTGVALSLRSGVLSLEFGQDVRVQSTTALAPRRWYHVAVVRRALQPKGAGTHLFINGEEVTTLLRNPTTTSAQDAQSSPAIAASPISVGRLGSGRRFAGFIVDVRVVAQALRGSRLARLYNNGLFVRWPMREGSGTDIGSADSMDEMNAATDIEVSSEVGRGGQLIGQSGSSAWNRGLLRLGAYAGEAVRSQAAVPLLGDASFTIMAWVYASNQASDGGWAGGMVSGASVVAADAIDNTLVEVVGVNSTGSSGGLAGQGQGAVLGVDGAGRLNFDLGGNLRVQTAASVVPLQRYVHIAVVKTTGIISASSIKLYVDGSPVASSDVRILTVLQQTSVSTTSLTQEAFVGSLRPSFRSGSFVVGAVSGASAPQRAQLVGYVDDARMYLRAASDADVLQVYDDSRRSHVLDYALKFDGRGEHASWQSAFSFGPSTGSSSNAGMTIEAWVFPYNVGREGQVIFETNDGPGTNDM